MRKPDQFSDWPASLEPGWGYRCVASGESDGDTIYCLVDLGLYKYAFESFRLESVDAPEVYSGPPQVRLWGKLTTEYLRSICPPGTKLIASTTRDRKTFDRFIAIFRFADGTSLNDKVNAWMYAQPWFADYKAYKSTGALPYTIEF